MSFTFHSNDIDARLGEPAETIRLNFGRIEYRYMQQDRKGGGPMGNVAGGWDLQRNSTI